MKVKRWILRLCLVGLLLGSGSGLTGVLAGSEPRVSVLPAQAELPAGAVLVLPLDEPAGATTFADLSGQANHGTCDGESCPEAGLPGKVDLAAQFDGARDRIDTPLEIDQSSGSAGVTMMAWVYPLAVHNERDRFHVISSDDGGFDWSILRRGHTWHVFTGEGDRDTGLGVQYGTWQHIAAVFEPAANRVRFYKNGRERVVPYLGYDASDNPIAIGDNPGPWDEFFRGKIDEVRVYDRALLGREVVAIYQDSLSDDEPSPTRQRVRVIALNKGGERQAGYQIRFHAGPGGAGELIATETTGADGVAEVRLPNGEYSYVAHKGCYQSAPTDFAVSGERVVISHKTMATVVIRTVDNGGQGRAGYLVRTYFADGTPQWRQVSTGSGRTRFSLDVLESHLFSVERNRIQGPRYPVGEGALCGPTEVRYSLATVTVHLRDEAGQDQGGYMVRVRRPDGDVHVYSWAGSDGAAVFYLMEGAYHYQVGRQGAWSAPRAFAVAPPQGGPGGVADDQAIEHVLD